MTDRKKNISKAIVLMLILLWVYTAVSKFYDYNIFKIQMSRQALPAWLDTTLAKTLPEIELVVAGLLLFKRTEFIGLCISLILMVLFTGYVGLAVFGFFKAVPCSCGGVIRLMGWRLHLLFNAIILVLTYLGIIYKDGERRQEKKHEQ